MGRAGFEQRGCIFFFFGMRGCGGVSMGYLDSGIRGWTTPYKRQTRLLSRI